MEVTKMILQFVATYGWQLALIACSGIFVLGVLKFFNVFEKVQKEKRKYLYAGVSSLLSLLASVIYLCSTGGFAWANIAVVASAIYGLNQAIYALYENLGFRTALHKLGNIFIKLVAEKQLNQAKVQLEDVVDDIDNPATTSAENVSAKLS